MSSAFHAKFSGTNHHRKKAFILPAPSAELHGFFSNLNRAVTPGTRHMHCAMGRRLTARVILALLMTLGLILTMHTTGPRDTRQEPASTSASTTDVASAAIIAAMCTSPSPTWSSFYGYSCAVHAADAAFVSGFFGQFRGLHYLINGCPALSCVVNIYAASNYGF
jgi:hypothetical protein